MIWTQLPVYWASRTNAVHYNSPAINLTFMKDVTIYLFYFFFFLLKLFRKCCINCMVILEAALCVAFELHCIIYRVVSVTKPTLMHLE